MLEVLSLKLNCRVPNENWVNQSLEDPVASTTILSFWSLEKEKITPRASLIWPKECDRQFNQIKLELKRIT